MKLVLIGSFLAVSARAEPTPTSTLPAPAANLPALPMPPPTGESEVQIPKSTFDKIKDTIGITYFSYFYGPGIHPDKVLFNPNQLGLPQNDGVYFQNQVSIRYKFSKNLALDFQTRFNVILNNSSQNPNFSPFRWEAPRIGVSGKLMSGTDWCVVGAVNTDFPGFLPSPLSGYQSQQRKVIFTPGVFATFKYEPKNSRWSVFSVISPRYFIYSDREAAESQYITSGFLPGNKPELILAFQPTVSYKLFKGANLTFGTSIEYRKHVLSSWNIFNASLITNGDDPAWRLNAVPINLGISYEVTSYLTVFPFISTYPIAAQRIHAKSGQQASLWETTSIGMWMYGTLF